MRYIYICLMSMTLTSVVAQVGINTKLPLKPLHIDGKNDNSTTGVLTAEQQINDVVVDEEGRVGIGTTSPKVKLDVRGDVSISGGVKVNSIESLPDNELLPVFVNKNGIIGTALINQNTSLAYLESNAEINSGSSFVSMFNKGDELKFGFQPGDLKINTGGVIDVFDGNVKIMEDGYYQLSFFMTLYMSVPIGGSSGNYTYYDQKVYFKSQILKSNDGGKTWGTVLVSIRPVFYVAYDLLYYTITYPNVIAKLSKNDLVKVVYTRSKKGNSLEGSNMQNVSPQGSRDLGFKTYQFSISKL